MQLAADHPALVCPSLAWYCPSCDVDRYRAQVRNAASVRRLRHAQDAATQRRDRDALSCACMPFVLLYVCAGQVGSRWVLGRGRRLAAAVALRLMGRRAVAEIACARAHAAPASAMAGTRFECHRFCAGCVSGPKRCPDCLVRYHVLAKKRPRRSEKKKADAIATEFAVASRHLAALPPRQRDKILKSDGPRRIAEYYRTSHESDQRSRVNKRRREEQRNGRTLQQAAKVIQMKRDGITSRQRLAARLRAQYGQYKYVKKPAGQTDVTRERESQSKDEDGFYRDQPSSDHVGKETWDFICKELWPLRARGVGLAFAVHCSLVRASGCHNVQTWPARDQSQTNKPVLAAYVLDVKAAVEENLAEILRVGMFEEVPYKEELQAVVRQLMVYRERARPGVERIARASTVRSLAWQVCAVPMALLTKLVRGDKLVEATMDVASGEWHVRWKERIGIVLGGDGTDFRNMREELKNNVVIAGKLDIERLQGALGAVTIFEICNMKEHQARVRGQYHSIARALLKMKDTPLVARLRVHPEPDGKPDGEDGVNGKVEIAGLTLHHASDAKFLTYAILCILTSSSTLRHAQILIQDVRTGAGFIAGSMRVDPAVRHCVLPDKGGWLLRLAQVASREPLSRRGDEDWAVRAVRRPGEGLPRER